MAILFTKTTVLIALLMMARSAGFSQLKEQSRRIQIFNPTPTLKQLKSTIESQSKLRFIYNNKVVDSTLRLKIPTGNITIIALLEAVATNLNAGYQIGKNFVSLDMNKQKTETPELQLGDVYDANWQPLSGVKITEKGSGKSATFSNEKGEFLYGYAPHAKSLELSLDGYETKTVSKVPPVQVKMIPSVSELQPVMVKLYGYYLKKNTIATIGSIKPPTSYTSGTGSTTDMLVGRIPGLTITKYNGSPGSFSDILIRGHQSAGLEPGTLPPNRPLILINGIQLNTSTKSVTFLPSMAAGTSALDLINPQDIETIEVLKDADATAIFGTRGAHGVINIITKSGTQNGKIRYSVNASRGFAQSVFRPTLMNTTQYISYQLGKLTNAGLPLNEETAPWYFRWPANRDIDWSKFMIGNTARTQQAYMSATGGAGKPFSFYCSAGFQEETSVLPLKKSNQKLSLSLNTSLLSGNKSKTDFSLLFGYSNFRLPALNPMELILLPPNAPWFADNNGQLSFEENGLRFTNPYAQLLNQNDSKIYTAHASLSTEFPIASKLSFKIRLGFNNIVSDEENKFLIAAYHPDTNITGTMLSARSRYMGFIVEPQLQYVDSSNPEQRTLTIFAGATYQAQSDNIEWGRKEGFPSDLLMRYPNLAPRSSDGDYKDYYKYAGVFSGMHYILKERYLLNLTARLDGSSRLGPDHYLGLFGSVGAGLIFTKFDWVQKHLHFLSSGKLRANIGVTGSDNIGDYNENNQVVTDRLPYNGVVTIRPTRLANYDLGWERNLKKEIALECKSGNWLSMFFAWYHNVTSRQFINGSTPSQVGRPVLGMNHDAAVLNTGFELGISTIKKWKNPRIVWKTDLTITLPKNELLSFKNLEGSLYAGTLVVGQSLTVKRGYLLTGVDPADGLNKVQNIGGSAAIDPKDDMVVIGDLDPDIYGGLNNELSWGQWSLSIFIEGRKQKLLNPELYYYNLMLNAGGNQLPFNMPASFLDYWKKPGDKVSHQKIKEVFDAALNTSTTYLLNSNRMLVDGSYLRIRYVNLNWSVNKDWASRHQLPEFKVFAKVQNLLTITSFDGGDPTIMNPLDVPSLRSFEVGLQVDF